jgi:hypothetical protein
VKILEKRTGEELPQEAPDGAGDERFLSAGAQDEVERSAQECAVRTDEEQREEAQRYKAALQALTERHKASHPEHFREVCSRWCGAVRGHVKHNLVHREAGFDCQALNHSAVMAALEETIYSGSDIHQLAEEDEQIASAN